MTWGDAAAEQHEKDQPSVPYVGPPESVGDYRVGDPIWYQLPASRSSYRGEVTGHTPDGTLVFVYIRGGGLLTHGIAGQHAINEGRFYRRDDGERIDG